MSLLGECEGLGGVFERLPRQLVPGCVILFSMMDRRGSVRMGGKFVELGGSLVGIARHDYTLHWNNWFPLTGPDTPTTASNR